MKIKTIIIVFKSGYYLLKTGGSLLTAWLTLGWKVRSARKSFEKQLIKSGMLREDAEQLSEVYLDLKNQILSTMKGAIARSRKSPRIMVSHHQSMLHPRGSANNTN